MKRDNIDDYFKQLITNQTVLSFSCFILVNIVYNSNISGPYNASEVA